MTHDGQTAPTARCSNSEPGTFGHECGKPATWVGIHPSGHEQIFCERCKTTGWEAIGIKTWRAI